MKKALSLILIIVSLVLLSSCTVESVAPDDSWESVFLQFWNEMNMEYVHFDNETDLDWDEVYDKYLPLFKNLDYSNVEDSLTAFMYFKEIAINIDDGHYQLTVRDNFNNSLYMSPSTERKWMAATESGNSNGFPDVIWNSSDPSSIMSVDKTYEVSADVSDTASFFETAIEGYSEVKKLTDAGSFHNSGTTFKAFKSCTFSVKEAADATQSLTGEEKAWNEIVKALGLDGCTYYYGVTEGDIFYFYFSSFFSYAGTPLSDELTYKETLTEEEKATLKEKKLGNTNYLIFHDYLWDKSSGYDLSGKIQYLRGIYEMFQILKSIGKDNTCSMTNSSGSKETYNVKGVIMDVRNNGGGDNTTLEAIFGSFFRDETKFAETRYKDGYNRYEYGPWMDLTIEKEYCTATEDYSKPFVIITNGYSLSCSELSASIVKNLMKKGIVVGGTTYGATCTIARRALYGSGNFSSKNLGIFMTSFETNLRTKDGSYASFEVKGITPTDGQEVSVDTTYASDRRFEAAVRVAKGESSST